MLLYLWAQPQGKKMELVCPGAEPPEKELKVSIEIVSVLLTDDWHTSAMRES